MTFKFVDFHNFTWQVIKAIGVKMSVSIHIMNVIAQIETFLLLVPEKTHFNIFNIKICRYGSHFECNKKLNLNMPATTYGH